MASVSGAVLDGTGSPAVRKIRVYRRDTGVLLAETMSSDGVTPSYPGDSDFASVALLLSLDGANNSTTILDASPTPKAVTVYGNAQISTAQSKFGSSSLLLDGSGDAVQVPSSTDFNFGTGNFTIELWAYRVGVGTGDRFLVDRGSGATFLFRWSAAGVLQFYVNGTLVLSYTYAFATGSWNHFAVVRSGTSCALYVNGVSVATATSSANITSTNPVSVGGYATGSTDYFHGYVDDVRITKGLARYTTTFTPPAFAHYATLPGPVLTTGSYSIGLTYTGEVNVICLDDVAGSLENDLILRTTPV